MEVNVGISNRHVHLKKETLDLLFGKDFELEIQKELSQKGQFASKQTVSIKGPKGQIDNVRILGPVRSYNQVEVSKTDSFKLGVKPPVRNSGDLEGSEKITIIGPNATIELDEGCIIATRHIHITFDELEKLGLKNNRTVSIKIEGEKGSTLDNVYLKASEDATLELHLDTDDANACLLSQGDKVKVIF